MKLCWITVYRYYIGTSFKRTSLSLERRTCRLKVTDDMLTRNGGRLLSRSIVLLFCHSMNFVSISRHWSTAPNQYTLPDNKPHVYLPVASITTNNNVIVLHIMQFF